MWGGGARQAVYERMVGGKQNSPASGGEPCLMVKKGGLVGTIIIDALGYWVQE